ncbi:MAG: ABC transporter permease [Melioribacteraceae bacterium]|nr:ABC transporter permease [Melioribacteraceae bacterium]
MSFPLFIVNKYIRSQKFSFLFSFVSLITIGGIAVGVTVVTIALSILDGFDSVISEKIINFNSHIVISSYGDRDLEENSEIESLITTNLDGRLLSYSKFIAKNSIIKSKKNSEGVLLYGIDTEKTNLDIKKMILSGEYFDSNSNKREIILGKKLAEKLKLTVGDRVTLFTLQNNKLPSYTNPPMISQFSVTGIFESGMPEYDDLKAYIPLSLAKSILKMEKKISGYNIRLKDISEIDLLVESLQESLRYPYYVRSIFQQHQNIFTWIELQKKPIPIVLGLIVLVAVFNIIGTILMNILERTSQIGILKSMGANRKQILKIFLIQGVYLGTIGIILGVVFSLLLSQLQLSFNIIELQESVYFLNSAPIDINFLNYFVVSVTAFVLTILSSIIPSIVASRIDPISAIRFN